MKALPKRKGNHLIGDVDRSSIHASMKALPKRKGNGSVVTLSVNLICASMKALPKRKGNAMQGVTAGCNARGLNESPSQKEGKFGGNFSRPALLIVPQ